MTKEPTQLDLIDAIKKLNDRIDALTPKPAPVYHLEPPEHEVWPKSIMLHLVPNKEDLLMFADKYSLTKEAKKTLYTFVGNYVTLEVNQDGTYKVV